MTRNKLSKVRKLAVALVLGNLALIGLLALVLPGSALTALPVLALMLPLLSAAAIEAALSKRVNEPTKPARAARLQLRALHQAA
jgi:hypothetical protein